MSDDVLVAATEYTVSILPLDFEDVCPDNRRNWEIKIQQREPDLWAVLHWPHSLNADGEWEYEPRATAKFPLGKAIELAKARAATVSVNNFDAAGQLAKYHRLKAAKEE